MDQSAAWLKPCGVRVWGTAVTPRLSSSYYPLLFSSHPVSLFSSQNPDSFLSSPCALVVIADTLCHGVRWDLPVVDGKVKCHRINIEPVKIMLISCCLLHSTCPEICFCSPWVLFKDLQGLIIMTLSSCVFFII